MFTNTFNEEYVMINQCNHYVLHNYQNKQQEILLYIHGGPGEQSSIYAPIINQGLTSLYHVIHYDQRGCGRTYLKNKGNRTKITISVLLDDLHSLLQHIKQTYKKEKVVLLGHSFGGLLASLYSLQYPEDISYLIAVAPLISFRANEEVKLRLLRKNVDDKHNIKAKNKLKGFEDYPNTSFSETMYKQMKVIREIMAEEELLDVLDNSLLKEIKKSGIYKWNTIPTERKMFSKYSSLLEELMAIDLNEIDNHYQIEVYYLLGNEDLQTPMMIAESYFDRIIAPITKKIIVEEAKHYLMISNHVEFLDALQQFKNYHEKYYQENEKKFYESIVKYYRYIFPVSATTVQVLRNEFLTGRKLLDIGCADGEYAKYLFNEGFIVDGIDLDQEMIRIAKEKEQTYLHYQVKDMIDIDVIEEYDGIYCIGNTLAHIMSNENLLTVLNAIYQALTANGKFYLQIVNYDRILKQNIKSLPLITNDQITFIREYEKRDGKFLFNTTLICEGEKLVNSIELHPIKHDVLIELLKEVGFVDVKAYDGFSDRAFDIENSYQLCVVAKK